jgi:PAS domain S-box-containing protein
MKKPANDAAGKGVGAKKGPKRTRSRKIPRHARQKGVTDEPQAGEDLRRREKFFDAFMEHLPGYAWVKDVDGRYVYVNKTFSHLDAAIGKKDEELWPGDVASTYRANDRQVVQAKKPLQTLEPFTRDPDRSYHLVSKFPIFAQDGSVVMVGGTSVDISQLLDAEKALNAQALRYKTLMETSTDSIYVLNGNGDLREANPAFLTRRGYSETDLGCLNVADWDAQSSPREIEEILGKLARDSEVFETRHRCKDGSTFDVEVCVTGVRIGGEQLFFCVARDVTSRKQAESALRQLAQASAASSDYIALIGRDFRYQFVNDAYLKARGLHLEDMIGRHMNEIVGQERFEQLGRPQVEACLRGEEVESFEWTDFRSDLRCFLHVKVAPLREPDGTISGAVMSGRDITARYEAEQAHRQSEERFRELAENINEVFWVWTAVPGNAQCLYVSPAYATIWGRSCESLYSSPRSWMEALHPEDEEMVLEEGGRMDFEKVTDWTYRIMRPDQSIRWIRDRIFPVRDEDGVVVRFAGIAEDITERKQAEAALAKVARQQAAVAELGKLALTGGELQELFDRAVEMVAKTLGVEYCNVWQLLPDDSALKLVAGVGWKEGVVGQATIGAGLDSQAVNTLLTKDLVIVEDLRTEKHFEDSSFLREHGVVSGLSVIIGEVEKPFGVLGAYTTRQRTFPVDDAHFFQSIANVLAEAIHRKRAEKAMQESERKYRELVELIHDLVWAVDAEGRITYMSPASRHIYGREPEEMIGHLFTDYMAPDEARRSMADLAKMIATGDSVIEVETRLLHRDGHEIVLSANAVVLRDAAGNIKGTTGTSRDITERKRAEEASRESEQRFRQLAENIDDVFWMSDPENTQMIYISPAYETIWGRRRETLYSSPDSWMDAIHPDDKERMVRTRAKRDSALPHDSTYRIVRPDGSVRWIRDRGFPVRDENGVLVRFAGIAEDITFQKQAEEALRESEQQMRLFMEATADCFWKWDLITGNVARSVGFNRILGYSVQETDSSITWWEERLHPDDREKVVSSFQETIASGGNSCSYEYRFRHKDGTFAAIHDRAYIVRDAIGRPLRALGAMTDITERKRAEQARERGLSLMLATLESTADGILVVNGEGKIETFNRLFAQMWRLPEEVLASKEDARALECVLDQLIEPAKFLEKVSYLYGHPNEESFDWLEFKDGRVFERYSRPQRIGGKVAGRVWSFRDATERNQAREALQKANRQLRSLSERLFHVQEQEKQHLARELHDEIGQELTAVKINLTSLGTASGDNSLRLEEAIALVDNLLRQVRQISLDLHPSLLDDLGLAPAVRSLLDQQARRAGIRTQFYAAEPLDDIDPAIKTAGFRIAQEAITNVLRHAKARVLHIRLHTKAEHLHIRISDDGVGFNVAQIEARARRVRGFGLVGMRERAALVGGRFRVMSSPDRGTIVKVSLPLHGSVRTSRSYEGEDSLREKEKGPREERPSSGP